MKVDTELLKIYDKILNSLISHEGVSGIVIAGGAIRDMLLEKPIKDIDIFYMGKVDEEKLLKQFTNSSSETTAYEKSDFNVTHGALWFPGCTYPIQLIQVDCTDLQYWIMDTFGCNLSKAWYGNGLYISQEFLDDADMEILTFPKPVSTKYMAKMTEKYPDFIVNGECNDDECTDL